MIEVIQPSWQAPAGITAFCTTRLGGISRAPYSSCNLGLHVGDEPGAVETNRVRLREQHRLPSEPCWIRQTHGSNAIVIEDTELRDADAAVTRRPGTVAVVMVADCLPILLCRRDASEVAAVHAGWRGLQAGVVQSAVAAMQSPATDLMAWIGPGISQAHFEVGGEVRAAFVETDADKDEYFVANRPGHWLCDLAGIAELVLRRLGVAQIERDRHCTFRDADRFYSYRRDATTGRMAALIWIN